MPEPSKDESNWLALASFVCFSFGAAAFGAMFTPGSWYALLEKPAWTPPNWLFGPVWAALYTTIAVAGWLTWKNPARRHGAMTAFAIQLILNGLWSALFFGLKNPALALFEIALLLVAIVITIERFWRTRPLAGALLLPYIAWVSFAMALNLAVWRLN